MLLQRLQTSVRAIRIAIARAIRRPGTEGVSVRADETLAAIGRARNAIVIGAALGGVAWLVIAHPPIATAKPGEVGIRTNQITGDAILWHDGTVLALPLVHQVQVVSAQDRMFRPEAMRLAAGAAPLQSSEGLSVGADIVVRYAIDPARAMANGKGLPQQPTDVVEPALQGVAYKIFARYTVREIFSTKRVEIQQALEAELKPRLAADGLALRSVMVGRIDLPADYKRGMEGLLAEELATQKMQYTLELKDKRVKETTLDATAEKARREVQAEAAAREQVIAARAQEEAMKHVLPLKQRQIEQRQLEAEAEKQARLKQAEGNAQARRIEATGEADARRKLAEAEVFRMEKVGQANAEQMAREGALISRHPLLIQKTLADKLSDKVQVIIAPPGSGGGFIAANLLGGANGGGGMREAGMQQAAVKEGEQPAKEE